MTDSKQESKPTAKLPKYRLFHVSKGQDGKNIWAPIGAAWEHSDGEGLGIQFDGRLVLRTVSQTKD